VNRAARVCLSVARRIRSQIGASTCGTMTGQQYLSVYLRDAGRSACQDLFAAAVLMHHSLNSCCAGRKKKEHALQKSRHQSCAATNRTRTAIRFEF